MVKADAYGHGLSEVALAVEDIVDGFGAAVLEEGIALRNCGITKPVLLLVCAPYELPIAVKYGLTVCIGDLSQLDEIEKLIACGEIGADELKVHIAADSGMHRLGFTEQQLDGVLKRLMSCGVSVGGVYSHLRVRSRAQINAFARMSETVKAVYPNAVRHLASSHSLSCRRLRYDAVRVGISAYKGAMSVESKVITARKVKAGEYISYGNFKLEKDTNAAVVFGGYADGVARERPSSVYIRGRECRVLGRVCMDMCVVDCGDFLPFIGEKAVFTDSNIIDKVSKQRGSVDYTVMTCWRGRVERIYEYDKGGSEKFCKSGCFTVDR